MIKKNVLTIFILTLLSMEMAIKAHAIEVDADGVGQLLMHPIYYALPGLTTDLVVSNVRKDAAVLAKVVFRTTDTSAEALNFLIYLSPGDTWRGEVRPGLHSIQGQIYSGDDSMLRSATHFASDTDPVIQDFQVPTVLQNDAMGESGDSSRGHIEIIGVRSAVVGDYIVSTQEGNFAITVERAMNKHDLKMLMDAEHSDIVSQPNATCGPDTISGRSSIDPCHLNITGTGTIRLYNINGEIEGSASLKMTALRATNYNLGNTVIDQWGDSDVSSEADVLLPNYVVSNPVYSQSVTSDSSVGPGMGTSGATAAFNGDTDDHTIAIEWALQAHNASHTWEVTSTEEPKTATLIQITFPLKYRHKPGLDPCGTWTGKETGDDETYSAPFQGSGLGSIPYDLLTCNNSEICNIPSPAFWLWSGIGEEIPINQFITSVNFEGAETLLGFSSGWNSYRFLAKNLYTLGTGETVNQGYCPYTGVPSMASSIVIDNSVEILWEKMAVINEH